MKPFVATAFTFVLALLTTGCAQTRALGGASMIREDQRVALVEESRMFTLYKVDQNHRGYGIVNGTFFITPGVHTITFTGGYSGYAIGTTYYEFKRTYDFAAGRTYVIRDGGSFAQLIDRNLIQNGGDYVQLFDRDTGIVLEPTSHN